LSVVIAVAQVEAVDEGVTARVNARGAWPLPKAAQSRTRPTSEARFSRPANVQIAGGWSYQYRSGPPAQERRNGRSGDIHRGGREGLASVGRDGERVRLRCKHSEVDGVRVLGVHSGDARLGSHRNVEGVRAPRSSVVGAAEQGRPPKTGVSRWAGEGGVN